MSTHRFRLRPEVRRAVARLNLSQNALARRCGLSSGFISQLLRGIRYLGPRTRAKLLEALRFDFDDLFEEVEG